MNGETHCLPLWVRDGDKTKEAGVLNREDTDNRRRPVGSNHRWAAGGGISLRTRVAGTLPSKEEAGTNLNITAAGTNREEVGQTSKVVISSHTKIIQEEAVLE